MWIFHQATGALEHNGNVIASGYSGKRTLGINLSETIEDYGPVPHGIYSIGHVRESLSYKLSLSPVGHDMQGRSGGFLIHGEYIDPNDPRRGDASTGCIILPPKVRRDIWDSGDHMLTVQH